MIKYLIPVLLIAVVFVSGCAEQSQVTEGTELAEEEVLEEPKTEEQVKLIANEMIVNFNQDDYGKVFDMLLPELQESSSRVAFAADMEQAYSVDNPQLILNKVEYSEDKVLVYYILTYSGFVKHLDAAEMLYIDGEWRIELFEDLV